MSKETEVEPTWLNYLNKHRILAFLASEVKVHSSLSEIFDYTVIQKYEGQVCHIYCCKMTEFSLSTNKPCTELIVRHILMGVCYWKCKSVRFYTKCFHFLSTCRFNQKVLKAHLCSEAIVNTTD